MYAILPNDNILLELLFQPIIDNTYYSIIFISCDKKLTEKVAYYLNNLQNKPILEVMLNGNLNESHGPYFQIKNFDDDDLDENIIKYYKGSPSDFPYNFICINCLINCYSKTFTQKQHNECFDNSTLKNIRDYFNDPNII
jgi:hypothetical protein